MRPDKFIRHPHPILEKKCCRCGQTKPIESFNHASNTSNGYTSACIACVNKKKYEEPEEVYVETAQHKELEYQMELEAICDEYRYLNELMDEMGDDK